MKVAYSPFLSTQSRKLIPKIHKQIVSNDSLSKQSSLKNITKSDKEDRFDKNESIIEKLQQNYAKQRFIPKNSHRCMNNASYFKSKVPRFLQQRSPNISNQNCSIHQHQIDNSKICRKFKRIQTQIPNKNKTHYQFENIKRQNSEFGNRRQAVSYISRNISKNQGSPIKIDNKIGHKIYQSTNNNKQKYRLNSQFFKKFKMLHNSVQQIDNRNKNNIKINTNKLITVNKSHQRTPHKQYNIKNSSFSTLPRKHIKRSTTQIRMKTTTQNKTVQLLKNKFCKLSQSQISVNSSNKTQIVRNNRNINRILFGIRKNTKYTLDQAKKQRICKIQQKSKQYHTIGPGYYRSESICNIKNINKNGRNLAPKYQFFGSTTLRFDKSSKNQYIPFKQIININYDKSSKKAKIVNMRSNKPINISNIRLKKQSTTGKLQKIDEIKQTLSSNRYSQQNTITKNKYTHNIIKK